MNKFINKEIYYSIAMFCIPVIVLFSIYFFTRANSQPKPNEVYQPALISEINYAPNPFNNIEVSAESVLVQDLNTEKIIYEKNSQKKVPLASLTKLMTALVIYEDIENLNQQIRVSEKIFNVWGNTNLHVGEIFILKDLVNLMLLTSSNHAAVAISDFYENFFSGRRFVDRMNALSKEVGINDTHFLNETGLDEDNNTAGSFGTARDISLLMKYILSNHPDLADATKIDEYVQVSEIGFYHQVINTNIISGKINGVIASKTGFTNLAGGNLAVVVDTGLNTPVSIIVLGSSRTGRFDDMLKLSEVLNLYFNYQNK